MILDEVMVIEAAQGKPRASGDDPAPCLCVASHGCVNPARAGMIPNRSTGTSIAAGKPRASGDDPGLS